MELASYHNFWRDRKQEELEYLAKDHGELNGVGLPLSIYNEHTGLLVEVEDMKALKEGQPVVVWDIGAGMACAINELQSLKGEDVSCLAINSHCIERYEPNYASHTVPYLVGKAEKLEDRIRRKALSLNRFPPDIIIMFNALAYSIETNTSVQVLRQLSVVLQDHGKVLVYDDLGLENYGHYEYLIDSFEIPLCPKLAWVTPGARNYNFPAYLQLTKSSSLPHE